MILLHRQATADGEIEIVLHRTDGSVSYRKHGATQTWVDARGANRAAFIDAAIELLLREQPRRVLVLGYGGGAASTLLHRAGVDVVSVDRDPFAERLAQLFFRAPPGLRVVVEDAARYVAGAPPAAFDGVLVDLQDSDVPPPAYLAAEFWRGVGRLVRPQGLAVLNVLDELHQSAAWREVTQALREGGLASAALSDPYGGNRLLVTAAN